MNTIIDRRKNQKGKSLSNRQRFIDRVKKQVTDSVNKKVQDRSIKDHGEADVTISQNGIDEPRFSHDRDHGDYDFVLPGNEDFLPGDRIDKPSGGGAGGRGRKGSKDGSGEDDFQFTLTKEEYLNIIFDGLELPNLTKRSEKEMVEMKSHRAGYSTVGVPANLNVERTAVAGLARRIALKTPKMKKIRELEAELKDCFDEERRAAILEELRVLRIRANAVRFLDNVDLRFNNFVPRPEPVTRGVMICVMDVSGSMGEKEKLIAKKFYILLYLFLQKKYEKLDVVFIRHHTEARECDEDAFFNDRETGGTVVSTGYLEALRVIKERYDPSSWNIYVAQASDGDNETGDNKNVVSILENDLLPIVQYMTYVEISRPQYMSSYGLWTYMNGIAAENENLTCTQISEEDEIVGAFRDLFTVKK